MNWAFKKLRFISEEMGFKLGNKNFLFVFEGWTFAKRVSFVFGKTDINDYDFEITLSSLLSIHFKGWKGFGGYPHLTLTIALLGFSLFIACEDKRENEARNKQIFGHVLDKNN
jgi:hypothetical protein